MTSSILPPVPQTQRIFPSRPIKLLIGVSFLCGAFVAALLILRLLGLVRPFSVPTGGMSPAVSPGDHVIMEGVSFLVHTPRRGDVVAFKTDRLPPLPAGQIYVKRVAGEPRDHLRIADGRLYVNGKQVTLSNLAGQITYSPPAGASSLTTDVTVPEGCYFVLGDNSTNSFDSRFWGSVPRKNILGRMRVCYWPPQRIGKVK